MPGAPDWLGYSSWVTGDILAAPAGGYPIGTTQSAVLPVPHYGAVMLRMLPTSEKAHVTLNWWEDAAGTLPRGADSWPINSNTGLLVAMPAEAPFVSVTVNNTGASNMQGTFTLRLVNQSAGRQTYPITDDIAGGINISIPASGFQKYSMGWIHSGSGMLWVRPLDTAGKVNYQVVTEDESGNAQRELYQATGPTAQVSQPLPIPDTIVSVHVTNTDAAAAHSFDLSLWAQPY